jgi:hypothetical protein
MNSMPAWLTLDSSLRRELGDRIETNETSRTRDPGAYGSYFANARLSLDHMDDPDRKRLMMRRYFDLAERVPMFAVTIARGLERLPDVLNEIERSIPAFGPARKLSRISHERREM